MAKRGCAAKKARISKARTPSARGKALAAYMKAGCGKRSKKRKTTKRKRSTSRSRTTSRRRTSRRRSRR